MIEGFRFLFIFWFVAEREGVGLVYFAKFVLIDDLLIVYVLKVKRGICCVNTSSINLTG